MIDSILRALPLLSIPLSALLFAPCARASIVDVTISGFAFNGQHITISLGDTVRWKNNDITTHTVTEGTDLVLNGNEAFHKSLNSLSAPYTVVFNAAFLAANPRPGNRYDYFCVPHSGAMQGSVTVDTGPGSLSCFCWPQPPCSNRDAGAGCVNSTGQGGRMMGAGSASVALDDLGLILEHLPHNGSGLVFRGQTAVNTPFGDGFLCINPFMRMAAFPTRSAGSFVAGPGLIALTAPSGTPIASGDTWSFQCWYRDPAGPCASGTNLSNVYTVTFAP